MKKLLKKFWNNILDIFNPKYVWIVQDRNNNIHHFYYWEDYLNSCLPKSKLSFTTVKRNNIPVKESISK